MTDKLLFGNFQDDLPQSPHQIRIFLSSTFKDYSVERNYLFEHVYKQLREQSLRMFHKDIYFIDMRWGITDEASNQQLTSKICFNEIEQCLTESIGPCFIAFLSHRYGNRFMKTSIEEKEFDIIKTNITFPYKHAQNLLDHCYVLDTNDVINREYKLKNSNEIETNLGIDSNEWRKQSNNLIECVRKTVESLYKTAKLTKNQRDSYFTSVTEQEIELGILNNQETSLKSLVLFRELTNIPTVSTKSISSFKQDGIEEELLNDLKIRVENKMNLMNKLYFTVDWTKSNDFKTPYSDEINKYLHAFGEEFQSTVLRLINNNVQQINFRNKESSLLDQELIHHAILCNKLSKHMIIRDDLITKIKSYLNDDSNDNPFIITAPSGAGKSTLMAYTAKYLRNPDDIVLLRFMGTSRNSSSVKSIFTTLIDQISLVEKVLGSPVETFSIEEPYERSKETQINSDSLYKILNKFTERFPTRKIIILLDSIDQLAKHDYKLDWMIYELPKNVKMILSVLPEYEGILSKLKRRLKSDKHYLIINSLQINEAKEMFEKRLQNNGRQLSRTQHELINTCIQSTTTIHSLHIKILFDISSKWTSSYVVPKEFLNCTTIKNTIAYMFKNYEAFHGQILFSRIVFYLTLFDYNGISENELEDILSIDDDVLNSVFQYHHPTIRRFPVGLWLKIKYELKDYITHKITDEVNVVSWFHRSFIEASQEYYKEMFTTSQLKDSLLLNVIDYFIEKWNDIKSDGEKGEMKGFKYTNFRLHTFMKGSSDDTYLAFRNTKLQKIREKNGIYNKRKLNELVKIIVQLEDKIKMVELLKKYVYFDYNFMMAKVNLKQLDFVIEMHQTINNLLPILKEETTELMNISEIYRDQCSVIQHKPSLLYIRVLSRLVSRSENVEAFASPLNVLLQKSFIKKESQKTFFMVQNMRSVYLQYSGPYMFIITDYSVHLVNSLNSKSIPLIQMESGFNSPEIILDGNEVTNVTENTNSLKGCIYYYTYRYDYDHKESVYSVYSTTFDGSISKIKTYKNKKIHKMFAFGLNKLVIVLDGQIDFLSTDENDDQEKTFDIVDTDIIESTLLEETVYSTVELQNLDFIYLIVGLSTHLQIFRFNTRNSSFNLFKEIDSLVLDYNMELASFRWMKNEALVIENSIVMADGPENKSKNLALKFAAMEEKHFKIVELDSDGKCVTIQIEKNIFSNSKNNNFKIEAYFKQKLVISVKTDFDKWNVYLYDTVKKSFIKKEAISCRYIFVTRDGLLCAVSREITLYKLEDEQIVEMFKYDNQFDTGVTKRDVIIKNNKALAIFTYANWSHEDSIIEYDYLTEKQNEAPSSNDSKINELCSVLSTKQILVKIERSNNFCYGIYDASKQDIINFSLDFDKDNCLTLGYNSEFITILKCNQNCLSLYKIEKNKEQFEFKEVYNKNIEKSVQCSSKINNCFFDHSNKNKLFVTLLVLDKKCIEIRCLNYDEVNKDCQESVLEVSIDQVELNYDDIYCKITDFKKYLVLWGESKESVRNKTKKTILTSIFYLNIYENTIIDKYLTDVFLHFDSIQMLPNSDDGIMQIRRALAYLKLNENMKLEVHELKSYPNEFFSTKLTQKYLIVKHETTEVWIFDGLLKDNKLVDANLICFENDLQKFCISSDLQYLIGGKIIWNYAWSGNNEYYLYVYRLRDKKLVSCIRLESSVGELLSSEEYITFIQGDDRLITFKIMNPIKEFENNLNDDKSTTDTSERLFELRLT